MENETTPLEKVNNWIKNSVMLKLTTITILVLLLLIPTSMITSIISEREHLNNAAVSEVSGKWADSQLVNGPILTIPLVYEYLKDDKIVEAVKYWHILPKSLDITGTVDPEKLRRGIYEIVVYRSALAVNGSFVIDKMPDENNLKTIRWGQAFLTIGISDLRGIEDDVVVKWNNRDLKVEPGSRISDIAYAGFTVAVPDLTDAFGKDLAFGFDLKLQGSRNLSFTPLGSNTNIKLTSAWPSPSFNGNFIPDDREVSDAGFSANWKVLQLNRNFPQSWIGSGEAEKLQNSAFGVDLILPLDDYQKSMRSAKYAIMTIVLTFLIFFLVEILNGRKIHPFQYTLVGLALSLFYILLISISEHANFNLAYAISTCAIVGMISLYSMSVFKMPKLSMLLVATLIGIYGFLFVTLQLADYALLMGSIGLTIILAITMYFTRNINWYKLNIAAE
ncbi:MAG: cell envelope integrity protein CreD [Imperialibacter sp.]|uniref:cell envelope integrity protein CreD n=1 Tax=Imperialibacter sp. TaxID=2038411 RepID=UPI0032EAB583